MAELVGGALLSGFLNVLFDRLASQEVLDFFRGKEVISKLLDDLKIRLLSANVLLNDAEEKQLKDQNVKKWLEELKEVVYEADHVVDKIDTEALRRKVEEGDRSGSKSSKFLDSISKFFSVFENTVKSEIEDILRRLEIILDQKGVLGLREGVQSKPPQRLLAPLIEETDVFGREADKEAIVKLLLSDDVSGHGVSVIPIVGMGGLGKTTLAQIVYKDRRVDEHFDLKLWLTVSEEFDVPKLTKMTLKQITGKKCEIEGLYQLQDELKKALLGKKFLFVHDDVWNEQYELWDLLKSPFESGVKGSKIIVTTRSKIVASKMGNVPDYDLKIIPDSDCWHLFAKHVGFSNVDSGAFSDLQEIGVEIIKKCKGVPLAVKSIAGLLRAILDPDEWRKILRSEIWELQNINILPALWLSYHFLPLQLKRCFAYCSIFPKDFEFYESTREELILLWMAEGLLQSEKREREEDVGEEYLEALISRSFFQRREDWPGVLLMHDLVHDLAMYVSGEFCYISYAYKDIHHLKSKTRHLSYRNYVEDVIKLESLSETKCFRTLLALWWSREHVESTFMQKVADKVLQRGEYLRALSFDKSPIEKLPDSIGNLKHLRYLNLSLTKIKEIPGSACRLYNLQTLELELCQNLKRLPSNFCNLINLRHLNNRHTSFEEMPPQMSNMRNLQTLSCFVLGENGGSRIKELRELHLLRGSLEIRGLQNVVDVGDVAQANLKNKKFLGKLSFHWLYGVKTDDTTKERKVLDALQAQTKLKMLKIDGFRGTIFPNWVAHESYRDMVEVSLSGCENCCLLPPLGQLPSLKNLHIVGFNTLESIGDEVCGSPLTKPFPSLKKLSISLMNSLEKWSFLRDQESRIFPHLEELHLSYCYKLTVGLPTGRLPSLRSIQIWWCDEMVTVFPTSQVQIEKVCPSLESLLVSGCQMLFANRVNWNLQRLSSLQSLHLIDCELEDASSDSFPEEALLPYTLTCLTIDSFKKLKGLNGKAFQKLTSLQVLKIRFCTELECLPEEGMPLSLTHLVIDDCSLLNPRCQRGTGEDWSKIQHIPNISIR